MSFYIKHQTSTLSMPFCIKPINPFKLRLFQQSVDGETKSLSGSYAELVDMESLLAWDNELLDSIKSVNGGYPNIFGGEQIRQLIADFLGLNSRHTIVTNGVDDAIPGIYGALFRKNDGVSFLQNCYEPLVYHAKKLGIKNHTYSCRKREVAGNYPKRL